MNYLPIVHRLGPVPVADDAVVLQLSTRNVAADYETSTFNLLERLDLSCTEDFEFEPRMKRQSDQINDDWTKRYSELRLGRDFDLVPVPVEESARKLGS